MFLTSLVTKIYRMLGRMYNIKKKHANFANLTQKLYIGEFDAIGDVMFIYVPEEN